MFKLNITYFEAFIL